MKKDDLKNIRLISGDQVKKAYSQGKARVEKDIGRQLAKKQVKEDYIEELPKEVLEILGETLLFIDKMNKMEGNEDEDK